MFIRLFSMLFAPEGDGTTGGTGGGDAGKGGQGAGGLMADHLKGGQGGGTPEPVKPEDARKYLADFVHDPDGLKTMDDAKVVEYHGRVTANIKKHNDALQKTEFEKRTRPAHIPEQFWDAEKREIKLEAFSKSWGDFRAQAQGKAGQAPKTPADYQLTLPEGVTIDKDDKVVAKFREVAHAAGLSNDAFNKIAGDIIASGVLQPEAVDSAAEMAKLGPQAGAMVAAVTKWGENMRDAGIWTEEDFNEVVILGSSAEGIRALNKLREYYGGEKIPTGGESKNTAQSAADWYAKHNAPDPTDKTGKRLRIHVDAAYYKEVMEEAKQIFGEGGARSSMPGMGLPR